MDRDTGALARRFAGDPAVEIRSLDLEDGGPWRLGQGFDGIVVTNYFHRPLFAPMIDALAPGGAVLYETFMLGNERFGKPSNPDFLLKPGELLAAFGPALTVVAFEQGIVDEPRPAALGSASRGRQGTADGAARYSAASGFLSGGGGAKARSCDSDGTWRRASSTFAGSISATITPTPSSASASTSPQGATMSECP